MAMKKFLFLISYFLFIFILSADAQKLSTPYISSPEMGSEIKLPISLVGNYKQVYKSIWHPGAKIVVKATVRYVLNGIDEHEPAKTYVTYLDSIGNFRIPLIEGNNPPRNATKTTLQVILYQEYKGTKSEEMFVVYPLKPQLQLYTAPEEKVIIKKDFKTKIPKETKIPVNKKVITKPAIEKKLPVVQ